MCFFDLTNAYFEGQAKANPKAKRGVIFRDDEDREAFAIGLAASCGEIT
jgi:hypothetical protein